MKKNILITGSTSGIGYSVLKNIDKEKYNIYFVGRDPTKGKKILDEMKNSNLNFLECDLSELSEIKKLISKIKEVDCIDILINNAGAIYEKREINSDKIEKTFALNHLSYFYLTIALLEKIKKSPQSQIINVASNAHKRFSVDLNDLENKKNYSGWKAYCQSKLLNIYFTYEFSKRYSIRCNCIHPGFVNSNFGNNNSSLPRFLINILKNFLAISPDKAAETILFFLKEDPSIEVTGKYFVNCKEKKSSKNSYDEEISNQIWDISYKYIEKYLSQKL